MECPSGKANGYKHGPKSIGTVDPVSKSEICAHPQIPDPKIRSDRPRIFELELRMDASPAQHMECTGELVLVDRRSAIEPEKELDVKTRRFIDDDLRFAESRLGLGRLKIIEQKERKNASRSTCSVGGRSRSADSAIPGNFSKTEILRLPAPQNGIPKSRKNKFHAPHSHRRLLLHKKDRSGMRSDIKYATSPKPTGAEIGLRSIVESEHLAVTTLTKNRAPEFRIAGGVLSQLEVLVSKNPRVLKMEILRDRENLDAHRLREIYSVVERFVLFCGTPRPRDHSKGYVRPFGVSAEQSKKRKSPVAASRPTTSGSPPVRSISPSISNLSGSASNLASISRQTMST
jgi:hypothetical protein